MKMNKKKVLDVIEAVAIPVGMSIIAYGLGLRKGKRNTKNECDKQYNSLCEECDGYMYRLENLTDTVDEFSMKTGIDITKPTVVLENEEALDALAKKAIDEYGFGRDGDRDYNFKIISLAQKDD